MKNIKKFGKAVAGSALLVGATLAGAAGMSAAQTNQNQNQTGNLGEYPQPFVNDDGEVDTSIVVGENAKTIDVVGAVEIAGSLGNAAFSETPVSIESANFGWNAENGATLDTRNDRLFFNDPLNSVRNTLSEDDLEALSTTEFNTGGDTVEVEQLLYPGDQQVTFGQHDDSDNPALYVNNPTNVDSDDYLYQLQANFDDEVNFTSEDSQDEEIELFGTSYTVSSETTPNQLVLFGTQEQFDIESGQSRTVTVNGEDHEIGVVSVQSQDEYTLRVDGEYESGDSFDLNGQTVHVRNAFSTGDNEGVVQFAIGSEELRLQAGEEVRDGNGDRIRGTYVEMNGNATTQVEQLSSLSIYVGSEDRDEEFVEAGDSYSHPLFENLEFHFGGLNPDASESNSGEVEVSTSGDDTATVSFSSNGDDANLEYGYVESDSQSVLFEDSNNGAYIMGEGANVTIDDYFTTDAGDFSHMWQVTSIEPGTDEATVELEDQVSGQTVTADLDLDDAETGSPYEGTEIIDGQTYHFELDNAGETLNVYWGEGASYDSSGSDSSGTTGAVTSLYAPVDTESGSALTLADENGIIVPSGGTERQLKLPSTDSTGDATFNVTATSSSIDSLESTSGSVSVDSGANTVTVNNGQTYSLSVSNGDVRVTPADDNGSPISDNSVIVMEPEDEDDTESSYIVTASSNTDGEVNINNAEYSGTDISGYADLETGGDTSAAYDAYGAYSEYNEEEQGTFTLRIPFGQAVAGAAFTDEGGSLSPSAGGENGTSQQPTGWPETATLDTSADIDQQKQETNMILVGGPAINELTNELAQDNQTMEREEYQEGQALIQLIEGAFTEGNDALIVAGHAGEDTLEASRFLANYEENQDRLSGQNQITLETDGDTGTPQSEGEDTNETDNQTSPETENETLNNTE